MIKLSEANEGQTFYFKIGNDPKLKKLKIHKVSPAEVYVSFLVCYPQERDYVIDYYKYEDVEAVMKC